MRASRSVGCVRLEAVDRNRNVVLAVVEPVHGLGPMPAGDDHGGGTQRVDLLGELLTIRVVGVGHTGKRAGFVQVRRHHRREREQPADENLDGIVLQELGTGGRHHHGVNDKRDTMTGEKVRDGLDDPAREEHPGLRCIHADVVEHDLELVKDELRWGLVHGAHLDRGLSRQRDDRAHAVTTEGCEGLEVGLNAGTAAGIRARDGQTAGNHRRVRLASPVWRS